MLAQDPSFDHVPQVSASLRHAVSVTHRAVADLESPVVHVDLDHAFVYPQEAVQVPEACSGVVLADLLGKGWSSRLVLVVN